MKDYIKNYLDKFIRYLPVAVFIFSLVFMINVYPELENIKTEYGIGAIDVLIDLYLFYFIRTLLLTLFIPLYDVVLSTDRFSYLKSMMIHYALITITVGIIFYQKDAPMIAFWITIGLCTIIYALVRLVIYLRERQFVKDANQIFKENKKSD